MRDGGGALNYLLADALGSTVGAIAPDGTVSTQTYWPFGATRTAGALGTDKQYTGQQQEATGALQDATNALGTYFYRARFYSTVTAHFVSPDSSAGDGPNRFAYVLGNPVRYSDPSGRCAWEDDVKCDSSDILRFISCGLGEACSVPEGVSENDVRALARWVLGQPSFWDRAFRLNTSEGTLGARIIDVIVTAFVAGRDLGSIGDVGWAALGKMYSVPGAFFRASLFDLIDGGHRVKDLFGLEIIGARTWWQDIGMVIWSNYWKNTLGIKWDTSSVWADLWSATAATADVIPAGGLNSQPWSEDQRMILHGEHYAVDLTGPDPWNEIEAGLRDCVKSLGGDCFVAPGLPFTYTGG